MKSSKRSDRPDLNRLKLGSSLEAAREPHGALHGEALHPLDSDRFAGLLGGDPQADRVLDRRLGRSGAPQSPSTVPE